MISVAEMDASGSPYSGLPPMAQEIPVSHPVPSDFPIAVGQPVLLNYPESVAENRCQICGKFFANQYRLNIHHQSHTDVRKHTCPRCGKSFKLKHHLKNHMITHVKDQQ